jgi:(p)ppGpp synthase/HD superfamily hydrolase
MTNKHLNTLLSLAISIASKAFEGLLDRGGRPYILHCLWVMNKVRHLGPKYMIVAVLHDLIEDTFWTIEMLRGIGFPEDVLEAIDLLTHKDDLPYNFYIMLLSENQISRAVKMRDLEHNSKITRLKDIRMRDLARIEKYHKSYKFLKDIDNENN